MKKTSFLPLMAMGAAICFATSCGSDDPGTLNGEFSVSPTLKVKFAQGNLQYQPSTKTYRFADNQWQCLSKERDQMSETDTVFWDLFNWGTGTNPATKSDTFVDWGTNPVSNGGNEGGIWRCLSGEEWEYLILKRENAGNLTAWATVNEVKGIVVLPDNFKAEGEIQFTPVDGKLLRSWKDQMSLQDTQSDLTTANTYSLSQWKALEEAGAMFLPYNATRFKDFPCGGYWLPTKDYLSIENSCIWPKRGCTPDAFTFGVRLVKEIKN
ncbi:MAG: hypothetical protein J6Z01_11945 [Bacteroidales bacterium]|nr:hypothetical protein [Bacteroidales bacterium]